jgi:uncharacterized protein (TIGR02147 family)
MNPKISDLYEFADFRKFLEDYQARRQAFDKTFTRSRFCRELGLPNTRSYFIDVVSGRRPLSSYTVNRFIQVMRMDDDEAQYFRILVDFNQSTHDKERELLFDQLVALNRTPRKFVDPDQYEFYKHWYHTAVFSLLELHDSTGNPRDLAKRVYPPITPGQAQESIRLLERLGMIRKNAKGIWKATSKTVDSGRMVQSELVKQYQLQCLELAKSTMLMGRQDDGLKNFSTVTLSLSEGACRLIASRIRRFRSEMQAIAHKDAEPADRVYQLNIQYFPQSNPGKT